MKILYFNYMTTAFASILRSLEYAKALADQGHHVTLCYLNPYFRPPAFYYDLMESYQSENFHVYYPPRPNTLGRHDSAATSSAPTPKAALGKVVEGKPTLKGLYRQIISSLRYVPVEINWVKKVQPDVLMARPDHILSFVVTSKLRRLPLVMECDGPVEELDYYWGLNSKWVKPFDTWRAKNSDALLYISQPCGELWKQKKISPQKLFYTPNGVHPEQFKPSLPIARENLRKEYNLQDCKVIGFSGNLRAWHGVDLLISAALPLLQKETKLKLLFIGAVDDPQSLALQKVPEEIRKQQFVFTGPLPYTRMGEHIDLADCMAIPYPHSDFFYFSPMKLFEAMSVGKLIIAPHLGQIEEMLGGLSSPLLYDARDPHALAQCLEKAFDRISTASPDAMLGADARARILSAHTWNHRGIVVSRACEYAYQQKHRGRK